MLHSTRLLLHLHVNTARVTKASAFRGLLSLIPVVPVDILSRSHASVFTMAASSPRVLSIQSHVVSGYVGNKSATFPLQASHTDLRHFSYKGFSIDWLSFFRFLALMSMPSTLSSSQIIQDMASGKDRY